MGPYVFILAIPEFAAVRTGVKWGYEREVRHDQGHQKQPLHSGRVGRARVRAGSVPARDPTRSRPLPDQLQRNQERLISGAERQQVT